MVDLGSESANAGVGGSWAPLPRSHLCEEKPSAEEPTCPARTSCSQEQQQHDLAPCSPLGKSPP